MMVIDIDDFDNVLFTVNKINIEGVSLASRYFGTYRWLRVYVFLNIPYTFTFNPTMKIEYEHVINDHKPFYKPNLSYIQRPFMFLNDTEDVYYFAKKNDKEVFLMK
jgi:hypothetical protein